jgi:hypothetical protein
MGSIVDAAGIDVRLGQAWRVVDSVAANTVRRGLGASRCARHVVVARLGSRSAGSFADRCAECLAVGTAFCFTDAARIGVRVAATDIAATGSTRGVARAADRVVPGGGPFDRSEASRRPCGRAS